MLALYNQLSEELEETNRGVVALYAELDEKSGQLREASDAKNRFWATVSHELRTPLNSIIGLVRLLVGPGGEPLSEEQLHQIQLIGSSRRRSCTGERAARHGQGRVGTPRSAVVRGRPVALAERLRMTLRPTAGTDEVALTVEVADASPEMFVDEVMLTRILRNLLSNGLKFTEEGEVRLTVHLDAATHELVFDVTDTGIGIPEEHLERVFEEFFQVPGPIQARARGTGSACRTPAGWPSCWAARCNWPAPPAPGTTVTLRLPSPEGPRWSGGCSSPTTTRSSAPPSGGCSPGSPPHIDEAPDGLVALEMMTANPPDLALVDLLMPRLDGAALMARMADDERLREVPVIVVTVATSRQYPQGARTMISKQGLRRDNLLESMQTRWSAEIRDSPASERTALGRRDERARRPCWSWTTHRPSSTSSRAGCAGRDIRSCRPPGAWRRSPRSGSSIRTWSSSTYGCPTSAATRSASRSRRTRRRPRYR